MSTIKTIPLNGQVIVKVKIKEEVKHNGVIIPVTVNQEIQEATVIKVDKAYDKVEPGDDIIFPLGAATLVTIGKEDYHFINISAIWAIL